MRDAVPDSSDKDYSALDWSADRKAPLFLLLLHYRKIVYIRFWKEKDR